MLLPPVQALLRASKDEAASLKSAAAEKARSLGDEGSKVLAKANGELTAASRDVSGISGKIKSGQASRSKTEEQLERTFVLNFGKKGELKDEIKEIKAEIKAQKKLLEKAEAVEEKAEAAAEKAEGFAAKQKAAADKVMIHACGVRRRLWCLRGAWLLSAHVWSGTLVWLTCVRAACGVTGDGRGRRCEREGPGCWGEEQRGGAQEGPGRLRRRQEGRGEYRGIAGQGRGEAGQGGGQGELVSS